MNDNGKTARSRESSDRTVFETWVAEAFEEARLAHGDLHLPFETFRGRILAIAHKHLRPDAAWWAIRDFARKLNTIDLYLASACGARGEAAWQRFAFLYRRVLRDLHQFISPGMEAASDLGDQTLIDMFLPDRSGQSRIASYDGRSSLATWLRVIVTNRSINERQRACNRVRRVEPEVEIPDGTAVETLDTTLVTSRYEKVLSDSLQSACLDLTNQDRLILLWRFEKGLQLGQIAKLIGVHQSTVTRQMERMLRRLRSDVVGILASKYQLTEEAIDEALTTFSDPAHSISLLGFLRESTPEHSPQRVN